MMRIRQAIVVEGRYDKNTLAQLVDTLIIDTAGFGVFNNPELLELLRRLARERGLIVLTDSDGAGFVIRNYLKGSIDPAHVTHAYIPDLQGKERRKRRAGREGKLGVEGMRPEVLEAALRRAGAVIEGEGGEAQAATRLTRTDFYELGLTGMPDSKARRDALKTQLGLPVHLSATALFDALAALYGLEELRELMGKVL